MSDVILHDFLSKQHDQATQLAAASDILEVTALPEPFGPPRRYIAAFHCRGVVREPDGQIGPVDGKFVVGIAFASDHLRDVDPVRLITWLGPNNIVHPNVAPPFCCSGRVDPGVELVDLLYRLFGMITYENWAAHDFLNAEAAEWARRHQELFPLERRSLKRVVGVAQGDRQPPGANA